MSFFETSNSASKPQTTQPLSPMNNPAGKRLRSSGKGNLGCLFGLLILVALGYFGYKFIPHYVSHFQLKDALNEIAVYRAAGRGGSEKTNDSGGSHRKSEGAGNSAQAGRHQGKTGRREGLHNRKVHSAS